MLVVHGRGGCTDFSAEDAGRTWQGIGPPTVLHTPNVWAQPEPWGS